MSLATNFSLVNSQDLSVDLPSSPLVSNSVPSPVLMSGTGLADVDTLSKVMQVTGLRNSPTTPKRTLFPELTANTSVREAAKPLIKRLPSSRLSFAVSTARVVSASIDQTISSNLPLNQKNKPITNELPPKINGKLFKDYKRTKPVPRDTRLQEKRPPSESPVRIETFVKKPQLRHPSFTNRRVVSEIVPMKLDRPAPSLPTFVSSSTSQAVISVNQDLILPVTSSSESIKRITSDTLFDVLQGMYSDKYDQLLVIDCRFDYEFKGGHIKDAINIGCSDLLDKTLFSESMAGKNILVIFHCEYSLQRGPKMASHLRNMDRKKNCENYPYLDYPNLYILEGGYKDFFYKYPDSCEPKNYIEMQHSSYKEECKQGMIQRQKQFRRCFSDSGFYRC